MPPGRRAYALTQPPWPFAPDIQGIQEPPLKKSTGEMVAFERFNAILQAQGGRCDESSAPFVFDSKDLFPSPDRIDNNGGYEDGNV